MKIGIQRKTGILGYHYTCKICGKIPDFYIVSNDEESGATWDNAMQCFGIWLCTEHFFEQKLELPGEGK